MMTNDNSITFPFPQTLQESYQRLMSSRDNFLKKLSTAERQKLATSYELLINAWAQNRTEQQKNTIEELSAKLNLLSVELKNDGINLKNTIEQKLKQQIEANLLTLREEEADLTEQKKSFTDIIKTWKYDILTRSAKLSRRQEMLNQSSTQQMSQLQEEENQLKLYEEKLNNELSTQEDEWTASITKSYNQLAVSKEQLNEILQTKEQLLTDYEVLSKKSQDALNEHSATKQNNLDTLKQTREQQYSEYTQTERRYRNDLQEKQMNLERNLKNYETELLLPLKMKLLLETPDLQADLKSLWMDEETLFLSRMPKQITKDFEQLRTSLSHQLVRRGYGHISVDELMAAAAEKEAN